MAFTSRSLVRVLWIVHELIWGIRPSAAPSVRGALAVIAFATALFLFADLIGWMGSQSAGLRLLAVFLTIIVASATWLLASYWLPHRECTWSALLPGALIVGVGVGLLHLATVTYIAYEVTKKSSTYGTVGVAIGLLLWTYMLGRLLTASIAADAAWSSRRETESTCGAN